jgi:hypothetical protein
VDQPTATDPLGAGAFGPSASFGVAGDTAGIRAAGLPLPPSPPGYELLGRLGGGGMGDVYLARELASRRLVAMKFLRFPGNPVAFDRFVRELQILAALDYPNIVRLFAHDFLCATPFFTMEYLEPGSLSRRVDDGPLSPAEAVRVVRAAAGALAAAHASGIFHRDVKPSNILLTAGGAPKLADFGLAKLLDDTGSLTPSSGGLGTPAYMPPEQISKRYGGIGPWSDVYGLGAALYHLLTGRPPFEGETPLDVVRRVTTEVPRLPRKLRPEIPAGLEAVVVKCLEKRPKDRYQSMAELVAELDRYETKQLTAAPEMTRARRVRRWAVRNRARLAAAAGAVLLAVGLVAAGWAFTPVAPPPPAPKSPAELMEERRTAIHTDLLARKPVTLVGEEGVPLWYETPTGPIAFGENPTRTTDDPGGCFFNSFGFTLLKLLDPPIDRYRVELQIRHIKGQVSAKPTLGFFVGYEGRNRPDGWTEYPFLSIGFNDHDQGSPAPPLVPSAVKAELYCFASTPGHLPHSNWYPLAEQKLVVEDKLFPGPWRRIVVLADPDRVRMFWNPPADALDKLDTLTPLADLLLADLIRKSTSFDNNNKRASKKSNHEFGLFPRWSPRNGIGIWANGAEVAIKNVVISPLK